MNLKQLEAFVSVAETGSFTRTAQQLYLTQPTISSHISSLEKDLNKRLIVRNTRGVSLSEAGKKLYPMARKMLELEKEIEREFAGEEKGEEAEVVRIAASTIPSQYILPEALAAFSKEYPEVRLEIFEGDSAQVIEMITNGEAEVGFCGMEPENTLKCRCIPFYRDQLVVMTPNNEKFRVIADQEFESEYFYEEPLIMREAGSGTRREAERCLLEAGVDIERLRIAAVISNQEAIKKTVAGGMGISVISEAAIKDYLEEGKALGFSIRGLSFSRNLNIITSKEFKLSGNANKLAKYVRKYYL